MSNVLKGLKILLGVTGGIAAYKSAELCRLFVKAGANVQVVMSEAACEFITPLTMETLSGHPVPVTMFGKTAGPLEHIDLPTDADLMVVAPATADYLARCATGRASDLISSITLAFSGQVIAAPAMNTVMYENPATQRNMNTLRESHNWILVEPDSGQLACGTTGKGRMAAPETIVDSVAKQFNRDLLHKKIVISAGPTVEDIDPVRFLSNRSSGKTGYAIASRALARGADVVLISGPVNLSPPSNCTVQNVRSALQMEEAIHKESTDADAVIMCAAVADYRPAQFHAEKIKKEMIDKIELVKNPDILAGLGKKYDGESKPTLIGFALETTDLAANAARKLKTKGADAIVSNLAEDALEGDQTKVTILRANGEIQTTKTISKTELADIVLDLLIK